MAMSSIPSVEENHLEVEVRRDPDDYEVIEEEIESENDEDRNRTPGAVNVLSTSSRDVVTPPFLPVCGGSVRVTKSKNVHFGNNTYYNGPVTIKQIVQSKDHDNPGYEHTKDDPQRVDIKLDDADKQRVTSKNSNSKKGDNQMKLSRLRLWLKLTFSAVGIVIVGGICAIISVKMIYTDQDDNTSNEGDSKCNKVEGIYTNNRYLKLILISMFVVLLTYIVWCYKLLTKETHGCDNTAISVNVKHNAETKKSHEYNLEADPLLIAPAHLRIVSRIDWLAQPVEKPLDKIRLPAPWVIIQHTATESCNTQSKCVLQVRLIQMLHVEARGWYDIGYNFLVAGDGSAYTGRGWEYQGAHTLGYNKYSMGIAFVGTFNNEAPPKKQLDACKKLIQRGVELGKIAKDYKLFAHRQLASTLSPGDKLFEILKEWPHFVKNTTSIETLVPNY